MPSPLTKHAANQFNKAALTEIADSMESFGELIMQTAREINPASFKTAFELAKEADSFQMAAYHIRKILAMQD